MKHVEQLDTSLLAINIHRTFTNINYVWSIAQTEKYCMARRDIQRV